VRARARVQVDNLTQARVLAARTDRFDRKSFHRSAGRIIKEKYGVDERDREEHYKP